MATFDPDTLDARSPELIASLLPTAHFLCQRYFRLRVSGLQHLGAGPILYVGNHNNGLAGPEVLCTLASIWDALGPEAPVYALAHDFAMRRFPLLGRAIQRLGAVRASRPNADRILGSIRIEPNRLPALLPTLPKEREVYLYCSCQNEATSQRVAELLHEGGFEAKVVVGGLSAWKKAGHPLEKVPAEDVVHLPRFV